MHDLATPFDRRVLEEFVYARVRLAIDLDDLDAFADDLSRSFERAGGAQLQLRQGPEPAIELLESVWARVVSDVFDELIDAEVARSEPANSRADGTGAGA